MLPIEIYPPFLKRLNALSCRFIWGFKWGPISRLNLACSVEMGGAKMLHLTFFVLALQWKQYNTFFTYTPFFFPMVHFGNWSYK